VATISTRSCDCAWAVDALQPRKTTIRKIVGLDIVTSPFFRHARMQGRDLGQKLVTGAMDGMKMLGTGRLCF
jgi:hypothetical protein